MKENNIDAIEVQVGTINKETIETRCSIFIKQRVRDSDNYSQMSASGVCMGFFSGCEFTW